MANRVPAKPGPVAMPRGPCAADGCERTADHPTVGLCNKHYQRVRRRGTTRISRRISGSGTVTRFGYIAVGASGGKMQEHRALAERALGKPLPPGAEIHHVNGDRSDNRPVNLVICPSRGYHKMLHVRQAAIEACGNPSFRKCPFCKQYDGTENLIHNKSSRYFYHSACKSAYRKARSKRIGEEA